MSNRDILKNGLKNLGISVDDKMLNDFNIYREILVDWNQKMNLTGIEDEKEVYIKHFLDSVSAVTNGYIKDGVSIIDVGTGAGFPGLPLRICLISQTVPNLYTSLTSGSLTLISLCATKKTYLLSSIAYESEASERGRETSNLTDISGYTITSLVHTQGKEIFKTFSFEFAIVFLSLRLQFI